MDSNGKYLINNLIKAKTFYDCVQHANCFQTFINVFIIFIFALMFLLYFRLFFFLILCYRSLWKCRIFTRWLWRILSTGNNQYIFFRRLGSLWEAEKSRQKEEEAHKVRTLMHPLFEHPHNLFICFLISLFFLNSYEKLKENMRKVS